MSQSSGDESLQMFESAMEALEQHSLIQPESNTSILIGDDAPVTNEQLLDRIHDAITPQDIHYGAIQAARKFLTDFNTDENHCFFNDPGSLDERRRFFNPPGCHINVPLTAHCSPGYPFDTQVRDYGLAFARMLVVEEEGLEMARRADNIREEIKWCRDRAIEATNTYENLANNVAGRFRQAVSKMKDFESADGEIPDTGGNQAEMSEILRLVVDQLAIVGQIHRYMDTLIRKNYALKSKMREVKQQVKMWERERNDVNRRAAELVSRAQNINPQM